MIILGDQFPLNGGFLRWKVLREAMDKGKITRQKIRYDLHDVDAPWKQESVKEIKLVRRWSNYWSLGMRQPLALSVPEIELESVAATLKLPRGLTYLIGPATTKTIASENGSEMVVDEVRKMIGEGVDWLKKLAEKMGKDRSEILAKEEVVLKILKRSQSLRELFMRLGQIVVGCPEVKSTLEIYRDGLVEGAQLPKEYYWRLDNGNHRLDAKEVIGRNGCVLVPKGPALFLDFACRGYEVGFTGCGYLETTKEIRDRYLPGQSLKFVRIDFEWELEMDVVEYMLEQFKEKKIKRGKGVPEVEMERVKKIKDYWRSRPTELAYYFLGGEIKAKIERIII